MVKGFACQKIKSRGLTPGWEDPRGEGDEWPQYSYWIIPWTEKSGGPPKGERSEEKAQLPYTFARAGTNYLRFQRKKKTNPTDPS